MNMNSITPENYSENIHRLAVGFEPVDPLRGTSIAHPIRIDVENPVGRRGKKEPYRHNNHPGSLLPVISRYDSSRHALFYHPNLGEHIDIVLFDHFRRIVPRRLRIPIVTLAQLEAAPFTRRIRRPWLFPGAAYDVIERTTALRGRVMRDGEPMRWVRVEARVSQDDTLVGRAHGDDRGEFLLVIEPHTFAGLTDPLNLNVTIAGPTVAPTPDTPQQPTEDAFWDLPLETVPAGDPDTVSNGETLPTGYAVLASATQTISFQLGRIVSRAHGIQDFVFSP